MALSGAFPFDHPPSKFCPGWRVHGRSVADRGQSCGFWLCGRSPLGRHSVAARSPFGRGFPPVATRYPVPRRSVASRGRGQWLAGFEVTRRSWLWPVVGWSAGFSAGRHSWLGRCLLGRRSWQVALLFCFICSVCLACLEASSALICIAMLLGSALLACLPACLLCLQKIEDCLGHTQAATRRLHIESPRTLCLRSTRQKHFFSSGLPTISYVVPRFLDLVIFLATRPSVRVTVSLLKMATHLIHHSMPFLSFFRGGSMVASLVLSCPRGHPLRCS